MNDKLYTVKQVAQMFGMHPKTIRRYIKDNNLQAHKIGGQWRIREIELTNFMDGNNEFKAELENHWKNRLNEFIEGKSNREKGQIQLFTLLDIFVDRPNDARKLADLVTESISVNQWSGIDFNFFFEPEEMKARFILSGGVEYISLVLKIIEDYHKGRDNDELA